VLPPRLLTFVAPGLYKGSMSTSSLCSIDPYPQLSSPTYPNALSLNNSDRRFHSSSLVISVTSLPQVRAKMRPPSSHLTFPSVAVSSHRPEWLNGATPVSSDTNTGPESMVGSWTDFVPQFTHRVPGQQHSCVHTFIAMSRSF
jgi:hypothetical protein